MSDLWFAVEAGQRGPWDTYNDERMVVVRRAVSWKTLYESQLLVVQAQMQTGRVQLFIHKDLVDESPDPQLQP
jgi:hypothetical protein